jgi:hypothetical protein
MNWTELLKSGIEDNYRAAEGLIDMVDEDKLNWKPASGANWMTTGQLLMHLTGACGACCKGFVTGDWGFPEGVDPSSLPPDQMLPPAEKLPAVKTVAEARKLLADDKKLALEMLRKAGESNLDSKMVKAPWDQTASQLGCQLLSMIGHLTMHKSQLFYYLKLQGKPVNTTHMFGMQG